MVNNKMDTKVITGKIRMNYPNIFMAKAVEEGQEPRFSMCIMIPKSDKATIAKIKVAIYEAEEALRTSLKGEDTSEFRNPLRDGDIEKVGVDEFENHYFINASSKNKPGIVDKDCEEITDSSVIYPGCYGRASVSFYPYNQNGNKGVGCFLNNVQKLCDGGLIGNRASAKDDFSTPYEESWLM